MNDLNEMMSILENASPSERQVLQKHCISEMKRILGMFHAPKDKRYKSFVSRAADWQTVWMCQEDPEIPALQQDRLCVWPDREFVVMYQPMTVPVVMEVHDFMDGLEERAQEEDVVVHVFPNGEDSFDVPAGELLESMQEELDCIE